MCTITSLPPPPQKKNQLINTLTKYAMLLFFIILPEQQGYRDYSCWMPPFRLRWVLSAILKKSWHKQSAVRSFPVVSDCFFHIISGRFRSFPVISGRFRALPVLRDRPFPLLRDTPSKLSSLSRPGLCVSAQSQHI